MFEHCEAVLTPLGGGTIDHSLIRPRPRRGEVDSEILNECLGRASVSSRERKHVI